MSESIAEFCAICIPKVHLPAFSLSCARASPCQFIGIVSLSYLYVHIHRWRIHIFRWRCHQTARHPRGWHVIDLRLGALEGNHFSKVLYIVPLHGKCTGELNFAESVSGSQSRARGRAQMCWGTKLCILLTSCLCQEVCVRQSMLAAVPRRRPSPPSRAAFPRRRNPADWGSPRKMGPEGGTHTILGRERERTNERARERESSMRVAGERGSQQSTVSGCSRCISRQKLHLSSEMHLESEQNVFSFVESEHIQDHGETAALVMERKLEPARCGCCCCCQSSRVCQIPVHIFIFISTPTHTLG